MRSHSQHENNFALAKHCDGTRSIERRIVLVWCEGACATEGGNGGGVDGGCGAVGEHEDGITALNFLEVVGDSVGTVGPG